MASLHRQLNRIDALAVALSSVIGVGVFFNTGVVLRGTDGFMNATWLWLVVGLVCLTGAVLYADLSARVPEAGGPYAYVRVAFGRPAAFVYGWVNAGIAMPVRQASTVMFTGKLLTTWLPGSERQLAIAVLLLLAVVNLFGVKLGALAQRVFTVGKLGTLVLVIVLAIVLMMDPTRGAAQAQLIGGVPAAVSFAVALSACWYTYLGWQDVVLLAEELRDPRRDLRVVLIGTVAFTMALYLAVHAAVYFGLHGGADAYGELPARTIAGYVLGAFGLLLLTVLTLSSTFGGAAESMLVRPRIAMALARDGMAPSPIAAINAAGTPYGAILFHAAISLVMVASGTYETILPLLAFSQGFLGIFEAASYFAVRRARPELPTSRLHPWAPLVFIAVNIALCALTGMDSPRTILISLGALAALAGIYVLAHRLFPSVGGPPRSPLPAPATDLPRAVARVAPESSPPAPPPKT